MPHFHPDFLNRPRKKNNPETHLVRQIIGYLRLKGYQAGKLKTHGVFDKATGGYRSDPLVFLGVPDIIAFCPELYFFEVKILPNKIKPNTPQEYFRQYCKEAGINHYEINNLEQIQKLFP